MDLGISGRRALVCAASKGLGYACAASLARAGAEVTITARNGDELRDAASRLTQETSRPVNFVAGDISTSSGREDALRVCPAPDILVTNCGGPPPGDIRSFTENDWIAALRANMLAPLALINATVGSMIDNSFGRIVNITSSSVKSPVSRLGTSTGARAGLTGAIAVFARQVAQHNVTINNLLPGSFLTERLRSNLKASGDAKGHDLGMELSEARDRIPARRFGVPEEFGEICAFLCSTSSGYIVGQNILVDGGAYNSTLG